MDSYTSSLNDILLRKSDLPPADEDYLRVVDKEHFRNKYGEVKRIFIYDSVPIQDPATKKRIPKRLAAVLPLEVEKLGIIPIPFILDPTVCVQNQVLYCACANNIIVGPQAEAVETI